MSGHTPGPWRMRGPDQFGDFDIQPQDEDLVIVAVPNGQVRFLAEHVANAHLVYKAPEMRALLVRCERVITEVHRLEPNYFATNVDDDPLIKAVRALLAATPGPREGGE